MSVKQLFIILSLLIAAALVAACNNTFPAAQAERNDTASELQAEEADHHEETGEHYKEETNHHEQEGEHHADETDGHSGEMDEHHEAGMDHVHAEAPSRFQDMSNPLAGDAEAIAAGQTIFDTSCATCHGSQGEGDGPAAAALDPQPASLADTAMMQDLGDGYLFWRVSEGGAMEPFNSAMPAWGETLSDDEIWQVVSYVRSLSENHPALQKDSEQHQEGDMEKVEHHEEEAEHHADEDGHHDAEAGGDDEHYEDEGDHHE